MLLSRSSWGGSRCVLSYSNSYNSICKCPRHLSERQQNMGSCQLVKGANWVAMCSSDSTFLYMRQSCTTRGSQMKFHLLHKQQCRHLSPLLVSLQTLMDPERRATYDALAGFSANSINPFADTTLPADQVQPPSIPPLKHCSNSHQQFVQAAT